MIGKKSASCTALSTLNSKTNIQNGDQRTKSKRGISSAVQLSNIRDCENWTLSDALEKSDKNISTKTSPMRLPMNSFNHIAREVLSLEKSLNFYVDVLGFQVVPRPPFDCDGYWLFGYGLSLHLVATDNPEERKLVKRRRIQHFSSSLPRVDHIAFTSDDLITIKQLLDKEKVYYKEDSPAQTGIQQLFFFDPDGNVLEVSNCAPPIGEIRCN